MTNMKIEDIKMEDEISRYTSDLQPLYRLYSTKVEDLIQSILKSNNITPHSVTSREKSPKSLREKIVREGKSYENPLQEITDLAGVRIITFFPTDVDRILPILQSQFIMDDKNSVDKRKTNDPSIFGYASLHLVVGLTPERCKLPEYGIFKDLKCEIQVRTILQHAWAEIEHDIVYKSNEEIPFELRRKFASLAGMLEVADREFELLRLEESKVREGIKQTIISDNLDVPINLDSVRFYLEKFQNVTGIESGIDSPQSMRLRGLVKLLSDSHINSLAELDSILTSPALSSADKDLSNVVFPCLHSSKVITKDKCLLRYFLAIGDHLKLNRDLIATYSECPALGRVHLNDHPIRMSRKPK